MKKKTFEYRAVTEELKMIKEINSKLTADMKIIKNRYKEAGLKINMLYDKITESEKKTKTLSEENDYVSFSYSNLQRKIEELSALIKFGAKKYLKKEDAEEDVKKVFETMTQFFDEKIDETNSLLIQSNAKTLKIQTDSEEIEKLLIELDKTNDEKKSYMNELDKERKIHNENMKNLKDLRSRHEQVLHDMSEQEENAREHERQANSLSEELEKSNTKFFKVDALCSQQKADINQLTEKNKALQIQIGYYNDNITNEVSKRKIMNEKYEKIQDELMIETKKNSEMHKIVETLKKAADEQSIHSHSQKETILKLEHKNVALEDKMKSVIEQKEVRIKELNSLKSQHNELSKISNINFEKIKLFVNENRILTDKNKNFERLLESSEEKIEDLKKTLSEYSTTNSDLQSMFEANDKDLKICKLKNKDLKTLSEKLRNEISSKSLIQNDLMNKNSQLEIFNQQYESMMSERTKELEKLIQSRKNDEHKIEFMSNDIHHHEAKISELEIKIRDTSSKFNDLDAEFKLCCREKLELQQNLETCTQSLVDLQRKKHDLEQSRKEDLTLQINMKKTIGLRS